MAELEGEGNAPTIEEEDNAMYLQSLNEENGSIKTILESGQVDGPSNLKSDGESEDDLAKVLRGKVERNVILDGDEKDQHDDGNCLGWIANSVRNRKRKATLNHQKFQVPIKKKLRTGDDALMCHQCQRNDKGDVVRCTYCKKKRYCYTCMRRCMLQSDELHVLIGA